MRILDRYILKSVLGVFFSCLLTFVFMYMIIDTFAHLDEILKHKVGLGILLEYYLSYIPIIFIHVSPVACLLSTLYTFGRLNRNNEIIAMRASGLSIFQIISTVIIFGVICSIIFFWMNDRFVPRALAVTERIKFQMESGSKKAKEKINEPVSNLCMYGLKNRLFFVNKFIPATNTIEGIVILEHDQRQNIVKKVVANRGVYKDNVWLFYQSITYDFDENAQIIKEPQYLEEELMGIPETPQEFLSQRQRPELMTIAQLDDYIWKLSKSGAVTVIRNLKVDLYNRYTSCLTVLIIIFLGIPFSFIMRRRSTGLSSVGFSLVLGFLYYVLNAVSIALGKAGLLVPILASSFSHILAFLSGFYLINKLP